MSVEAMWQVDFGAGTTVENVVTGAGVVVLESGRIFGGDSWFYYTGTYEVDRDQIVARVRSRRHADGGFSVAGTDDETLVLVGSISHEEIELRGHVASDTQRHALAVLRRIAELP